MPLEQLVREYLLRSLESLGYRIVESVESQHFDNAECVLASPPVRARIVRERSQFFLDVGPPSDPSLWYDSAVVMEFLGLSRDAGFHDSDTNRVLTGMATFLQSFQPNCPLPLPRKDSRRRSDSWTYSERSGQIRSLGDSN